MSARRVRIAVIGAGLIGRRHAARVVADASVTLAAIVDPSEQAALFAREAGVPWHADLGALLATDRPDGAIVATPNALHVEHGLACIAAGLPVLVEKPIAVDVAGASRLVEAAERAGVPLLIGHHRRHNPLVSAARDAIDAGRLGTLVAVHTTCWFHKPDAYFAPEWRRRAGAGPVLVNLIHDVDLLRHLCGEVVSVQARTSRARRGFEVEDTAVALLAFAGGALGTLSVSDTIVSPWSWECTSGENADFPRRDESCTMIGGTLGALSIPHLDVWDQAGAPDWTKPLAQERLSVDADDPLALQIAHFADVARGNARPLVPGREGLATLRVMEAIHEAAASGATVHIDGVAA